MSNTTIPIKKKSTLVKTLQWLAVAAVSLLLVAYFIFSDMSGPDQSILVGKVNSRPVYYSQESQYARNYEQIVQNMASMGGGVSDMLSGFFEYQAFIMTVNQLLLYDGAKKNIVVSDKYIIDNIKGSFFLNDDGSFREADYNAFVKNTSDADKKAIENDIRENISVQTLTHELFQTIKTSDISVTSEYLKRNNKRSIEIIYYDALPIVRDYVPTDDELNIYFTENVTNFVQADLSWIVLKSASDSSVLYNSLKKNVDEFAQKAKEKSEDKGSALNGGNVGYLTQKEMPSAIISEAVFAVKKDKTLLEPMYYDGNYYIILVNNVRLPSSISDLSKEMISSEYLSKNHDRLIAKTKVDLKSKMMADYSSTKDRTQLEAEGYKYYTDNNFYYGATAKDEITSFTIPYSYDKSFSDAVFKTGIGSSSSIIDLPEAIAIVKIISEDKKSMEDIALLDPQESFSVMRDVYSSKTTRLARYWSDTAFLDARIEYKLSEK